jgi:hypothetical protein
MPIVKKLALIAGAVLFLCLSVCAVLLVLGAGQRTRAEAFLNDVTRFKLGEATFADAERLAGRYGGKPWNALPQGTPCTAEDCYLSFDFANPRNHLPFVVMPRVGLKGIVRVKEGRVMGIEVVYQLASKFGGPAAYDVRETLSQESPPGYQRYRWVSPGFGIAKLKVDKDGLPWVVEIRLNERATKEERKQAYSLDLSCLAKVYGCTSPSAIFPPAWQD